MKVNGNRNGLAINVVQNIFYDVLWKKESHTCLNQHEGD